MAQRRPPEREVDASLAVESGAAALRAAREREILSYPWGTPEVARQLLDARDHIRVPARHFAVFEEGEPASWGGTCAEGGVGQVEAVSTVPAFRGRGHASAVDLAAAAAARRAGADLVFLCADASDRPADLYRRLGFDELGRYPRFTRER
jgi:ribosomal protein S18 acetylase RimI-like enzyme